MAFPYKEEVRCLDRQIRSGRETTDRLEDGNAARCRSPWERPAYGNDDAAPDSTRSAPRPGTAVTPRTLVSMTALLNDRNAGRARPRRRPWRTGCPSRVEVIGYVLLQSTMVDRIRTTTPVVCSIANRCGLVGAEASCGRACARAAFDVGADGASPIWVRQRTDTRARSDQASRTHGRILESERRRHPGHRRHRRLAGWRPRVENGSTYACRCR